MNNIENKEQSSKGRLFYIKTRPSIQGAPIKVLEIPLVPAVLVAVFLITVSFCAGGGISQHIEKNKYRESMTWLIQELIDADQLSGTYKAHALHYLSRQDEEEETTVQR